MILGAATSEAQCHDRNGWKSDTDVWLATFCGVHQLIPMERILNRKSWNSVKWCKVSNDRKWMQIGYFFQPPPATLHAQAQWLRPCSLSPFSIHNPTLSPLWPSTDPTFDKMLDFFTKLNWIQWILFVEKPRGTKLHRVFLRSNAAMDQTCATVVNNSSSPSISIHLWYHVFLEPLLAFLAETPWLPKW